MWSIRLAITTTALTSFWSNITSVTPVAARKEQKQRHMLSICPLPKEVMCPYIYAPVSCGENKCLYDNKCIAKGTGHFDPDVDCCKEPLSPPICPKLYKPVTCGENQNCNYDNRCIAKFAGAKNCCPSIPMYTICPRLYAPVICGKRKARCKYDNKCMAKAAGAHRCCRLPSEYVVCPKIYNPVQCGRCKYDNACLAIAANPECRPRRST